MGRGLGRVQLFILNKLATRGEKETFVTNMIYDWVAFLQGQADEDWPSINISHAHRQSVWRAIRTLENRGLIESWSISGGFKHRADMSPGGNSKNKHIRLVQGINGLNSTLRSD